MTDPSTMTVAQLKEELKARGLDATGLKAALLGPSSCSSSGTRV